MVDKAIPRKDSEGSQRLKSRVDRKTKKAWSLESWETHCLIGCQVWPCQRPTRRSRFCHLYIWTFASITKDNGNIFSRRWRPYPTKWTEEDRGREMCGNKWVSLWSNRKRGADEWMNGGLADASTGHPSLLVPLHHQCSGQAHPPASTSQHPLPMLGNLWPLFKIISYLQLASPGTLNPRTLAVLTFFPCQSSQNR